MIVVAAVAAVVATVPLLGGRLSRLSRLRMRCVPLACLALVVQAGLTVAPLDGALEHAARYVHLLTYALMGVFLWLNRRIPGLWLLALGGVANAVVIAANGGVMPSSSAARAAAGIADTAGFSNSDIVSNPRLLFLGDVFAWPQPFPLANVFSVGDVLLVAGAALLLHRVCGSRLPTFRTAR